ncbi:MAG TPA: class I SAM-dependent methyltransferase [Steroidobacteraceae bacterium]|nr:class I SAM-dependent methyltransferase [Steroidobacteraceae bacterium]
MSLKRLVRPLIPRGLVDRWRAAKTVRIDAEFRSRSPTEVFSAIYARGLWEQSRRQPDSFSSGTGSHEEPIVVPYIDATRQFLARFPSKPPAVDLGCGDFAVGARVRSGCSTYVACDVVPELIERNHRRFAGLDVEFRVLDIVADPLPPGDVVFLRQVLQHLSNEMIGAILPKLRQYAWAVITEHVPREPFFTPNRDKPTGPGTRLPLRSGVVVSAPPFNFEALEQQSLCSVVRPDGVIDTTAYRLRD